MAKRINILEDDQGIREIMELILSDEGFLVSSFANVSDFRAQGLNQLPDLYMLYVMLPDGNGIDVCKELKAHESLKDIPVIMMSAHVDVESMRMSCGAEAHIAKPFDIYLLIDQIRSVLD